PHAVLALGPFHFEFLFALKRGPGVIRHNGNSAESLHSYGRFPGVNGDCLLDPANSESGGIVDTLDCSTVNRRMSYGGEKHSIHAHVLAVDRFADGHIPQVVTWCGFANEFPVGAIFELEFFFPRNWQFGRRARKFSVTQFFSAGLVNDGARFGDALALRYIPGFSGGAHQHQAGTGARFPQGIEETLYGVRAVGVLIAI